MDLRSLINDVNASPTDTTGHAGEPLPWTPTIGLSDDETFTMTQVDEMTTIPGMKPSKPRLLVADSDDSDAPADVLANLEDDKNDHMNKPSTAAHNHLFTKGRIITMTPNEQLAYEEKERKKEEKRKRREAKKQKQKNKKRPIQSESEADDEEVVEVDDEEGGYLTSGPAPVYFNNSIRPKASTPPSISLSTYNEEIPKCIEEGRLSVVHWISNVLRQVDAMPRNDIVDYDIRNKKLVEFMNDWCIRIDHGSSEPKIAIRYLKDATHFDYMEHSISGFKAMFQQWTIVSYNTKDYYRFVNYKEKKRMVGRPNKTGNYKAELNPYYQTKKVKKDDEESQEKPIFKINEDMYSVADIWLNHPEMRVCNNTVCNPRPANFKNAALPYDLNVCKYPFVVEVVICECFLLHICLIHHPAVATNTIPNPT